MINHELESIYPSLWTSRTVSGHNGERTLHNGKLKMNYTDFLDVLVVVSEVAGGPHKCVDGYFGWAVKN